jgi:glycosyltransferase involved in cell wall biosynthesis
MAIFQKMEDINIPSFSMIFETENLASVELENIYRSLESIATQDISPEMANEFLIIDSGHAPDTVISEICSKYPWITVKRSSGVSYYEAKMIGANVATGEIILYCDSDCVYVKSWISHMLLTFMHNQDVNIVAGETSTPVRNPYEAAIAMHYFFPRFSNKEESYCSKNYFLNNVAFRRAFLMQNPIPTHLPLYRGHCSTHSYTLCNQKNTPITTNPKAQAIHEPPTINFSFWRYLLLGHDYLVQNYIRSSIDEGTPLAKVNESLEDINFTISERFKGIMIVLLKFKPFQYSKMIPVLKENKRQLIFLPLSFLMILYFEILLSIGTIITYFDSKLLLKLYYAREQKYS